MTGSKVNEAYEKAKKCLDQLLSNDQIPFYGYVEIMLQLDTMMAVSNAKWRNKGVYYECSNCNAGYMMSIAEKLLDSDKFNYDSDKFNYCPFCGAKMEVNKDE